MDLLQIYIQLYKTIIMPLKNKYLKTLLHEYFINLKNLLHENNNYLINN